MSTSAEPSYLDINPNQRTPCVLVLDASDSMTIRTSSGKSRIEELNSGLKVFEQQLKDDDDARSRVQVAIVCVGGPAGGADTMLEWTDASDFQAFDLHPGGQTPLGSGLMIALDIVEQQKRAYKAKGISYTRPWMMVITDGEPTDDSAVWQRAAASCRSAEQAKKCEIYPIGVGGANLGKLQEISAKPPLLLDEVKFNKLFQWLSTSLSAVSRSSEGEAVTLAPPDWIQFKR